MIAGLLSGTASAWQRLIIYADIAHFLELSAHAEKIKVAQCNEECAGVVIRQEIAHDWSFFSFLAWKRNRGPLDTAKTETAQKQPRAKRCLFPPLFVQHVAKGPECAHANAL